MKKERSMDQLLNELNNNSLTDRERAEILAQILDTEMEKPEAEADMDLIQECFDYLELLNHSDAEIEARKAQLPDRLQRTYQKAAETESNATDPLVPGIRPVKRKRRFRKAAIAAAIVAAILLVAMTSLTVIARVNGYKDPWEMIFAHWEEYLNLRNGEQMSHDGITVIRYTDNKFYPDIESWLKEEKLDMFYPSVSPDGLRLDHVNETDPSKEEVDIVFVYAPADVYFRAQNFNLAYFELHEGMEIIEVNGYRAGILYNPDIPHPYSAYLTVDNFAYSIGAQDRDTLLFMLEHLKKPEL